MSVIVVCWCIHLDAMHSYTSTKVVVTWHDHLTSKDQNDKSWCHFDHFMLESLSFSYCVCTSNNTNHSAQKLFSLHLIGYSSWCILFNLSMIGDTQVVHETKSLRIYDSCGPHTWHVGCCEEFMNYVQFESQLKR